MKETPQNLIKKNYLSIIVLLISILILMFALYSIKDVEQRCNDHWQEEFNEKCLFEKNKPDLSEYGLDFIDTLETEPDTY